MLSYEARVLVTRVFNLSGSTYVREMLLLFKRASDYGQNALVAWALTPESKPRKRALKRPMCTLFKR